MRKPSTVTGKPAAIVYAREVFRAGASGERELVGPARGILGKVYASTGGRYRPRKRMLAAWKAATLRRSALS